MEQEKTPVTPQNSQNEPEIKVEFEESAHTKGVKRPQPPRQARPAQFNPSFELKDAVPQEMPHRGNPLLEENDEPDVMEQKMMSAFLLGVVTGAAAVGSIFLIRWILKTGKADSVGEAAEMAQEMVNLS